MTSSQHQVLGRKSSIQSEIGKSLASQTIIERYRKGFPLMIQSWRAKYSSLQASDAVKRGALEGFENTLSVQVPLYQKMFALRLQMKITESNLLKFMQAQFGDYEVTDKSISFKTPSNVQKYNELAKGIQNAEEDLRAYEKRQFEEVEAAKAKLHKLSE